MKIATNEHELLVGGIVRAALELAILRGDLRMDSGDAFEEMSESEREDVITDTWNAMNGEGTCDDEPVKELTAIYAAMVPAATQEPAGSGGSENDLWLELARILRFEKGDEDGDWFIPAEPQPLGPFFSILQAATAFMRFIDATDKTMRKEIEQLRAGSPRKVGEDGAQTFEQWWESINKFSTDSDRLDHAVWVLGRPFVARKEAAALAWNAALARPSSVPVGEQKQEEGV